MKHALKRIIITNLQSRGYLVVTISPSAQEYYRWRIAKVTVMDSGPTSQVQRLVPHFSHKAEGWNSSWNSSQVEYRSETSRPKSPRPLWSVRAAVSLATFIKGIRLGTKFYGMRSQRIKGVNAERFVWWHFSIKAQDDFFNTQCHFFFFLRKRKIATAGFFVLFFADLSVTMAVQ